MDGMGAGTTQPRWNHNIHYHRLILKAIPGDARSAVDAGTGNGLLAVDLRRLIPDVTGIDVDQEMVESARREDPSVNWVDGDFMTYDFGRRFDVVVSVATLHHLSDLASALKRLASLANPGGLVVVIGLARATRVRDYAFSLAGLIQHRWITRRRRYWEHSAPTVWPPPHSYAEVRRAATQMLPGMRWRQLPLWRYALVWTKPNP